MAIDIEVVGNGFYAGAKSSIESYSVVEDSTPAEASDSSGGTGQIKFKVIDDPARFGSTLLLNDTVKLTDGDRGYTTGTISDVRSNNGVLDVTADSRLGRLVVQKTAVPVHASFPTVIRYYLSLAGIATETVAVDAAFNSITVNAPGWSGDLYTKVKELLVTYGAEMSLLRGNVAVRPIRQRRALEINNSSESWSFSNRDVAKQVEVNYYNSVYRTNAVVYPKNGWDEDMPIYTVDAGERRVVNIPVGVALESLVQPDMYGSVPRSYMGPSSSFAAVGADGDPISVAAWQTGGGSLEVAIGANGTSIDLTIIAPGVGSVAAANAPFRIGSQDVFGFYSSLRVIGTGVHFDVKSILVPTGADDSVTSRDIGVTVDNMFISTEAQARSLALDVASRWASPQRTLTITKSAINRPGETGESYDFATFGQFDSYAASNGIATFAQFDTAWSGDSFGDFDNYWYELVQDQFDYQVFGNAAGSRVAWRRAMYRIRTVEIGPDEVSYTAEEDTTIGDFDASAAGMTIGQFDTSYFGLTFADFALAPLPNVLPELDRW